MKIESATLQLASRHEATQEHQISESLKMWVGERRPDFPGEERRASPAESAPVQLSDAAREQLATEEAEQGSDVEDAIANDPKLSLLRSMIELLTGRKIKLFDGEALQARAADVAETASTRPANPSAGFGVEYDYRETYSETEVTRFSAQGTVRTADGRSISFSLDLAMARSYYEESNVSLRLGNAAVKDPLVLNFSGTAAQLTDTRFEFDLDADGQADSINFLRPGSGFLAFDRNQDGKINDGRELFGALSGDGFADLAALDDDRNGWIDENDAAYTQLRVWSKDAQGADQLQTLQAANVGAISLARVSTPFEIKDAANQLQGKIAATGVFLQETGGAGTIQKIDLSV